MSVTPSPVPVTCDWHQKFQYTLVFYFVRRSERNTTTINTNTNTNTSTTKTNINITSNNKNNKRRRW